ncbi:hypothetical protein MIMGU_mgv1a017406mg [Erythranthe guttata]|uniref:Uncharacterized protein n=1 Tax=Erythranthe guttata TaxID=4155 RepID=A0A022RVJ9_ERYGU|nr:hypothetical protein MIMGU_mgv1a017406mg [Erythranthe guttata]
MHSRKAVSIIIYLFIIIASCFTLSLEASRILSKKTTTPTNSPSFNGKKYVPPIRPRCYCFIPGCCGADTNAKKGPKT